MKTVEEKTITLGQLKLLAEVFTHALRDIDPDCVAVKLIDRFIARVEGYVNSL